LLDLQNRDGGIPTFCRGWGHLPFDRSGPDLTAHALRAWHAWRETARVDRPIAKALRYLRNTQQIDGSWVPLWFGNQHAPNDQNRTFGTARVVIALNEVEGPSDALTRGLRWITTAQNVDGGWGGAAGLESSIEETSLAVAALASTEEYGANMDSGFKWLVQQ